MVFPVNVFTKICIFVSIGFRSSAARPAVEFCTNYLGNTSAVGIPQSRHFDRFLGKGTLGLKIIDKPNDEIKKAHFNVLQHIPEITPYIEKHMTVLRDANRGKSEQWLKKEHVRSFCNWLKVADRIPNSVNGSDDGTSELLKWLMRGPRPNVHTYKAYDINGYCFYTKTQDDRSVMQNSGVTLVAETTLMSNARDMNPICSSINYYGYIEEIWELDYVVERIPLFKCKWVSNAAVKVDEFGMTFVDFRREGSKEEPFIMAEQARQVFYVKDPLQKDKYVVVHGKQQIHVGPTTVTPDDLVEDCSPVCTTVPRVADDDMDCDEELQIRDDHEEGIWVNTEN